MDCSMGKIEANSLVAYGKGKKLFAEYCPGEMVGVLYGEVTEKLGLGPALHKAGTTMGLSSYGTPFDFDYQSYTDDIKHKMNVAASVQNLFENKVLSVLNDIDQNSDNLCLSGGSFLNCNANSEVVRKSKFKQFHHFPACGDDGTAVGSALYVSHHILGEARYDYEPQDICYTGRDYPSQTPDYNHIARQIADGKIIGWFQGKSEFGPRALGNRSILADPRNFHNRDLINHVVKNREWFRPFAPVVLEECYQDWFDFPIPSPYMLYTAQVKQPEKVPAITHVDGSARFQTVTEKSNKHYYNIIKAFGELTGVPVLLNTSLNGNGQPILETEEDAQEFYKNSKLDMMIINGAII
jgi:carbamoyltransferase